MMLNVLIPTRPDDVHALYVKIALDALGHHADLWFTADYPACQRQSFELAQDQFCWQVNGIDLNLNNPHYDVVWYRRPVKPMLPGYLHQADIQNAGKENLMFYQSIWQTILPSARWINPVNQAWRANAKMLQLKLASQIGLKIPNTLISNDPVKIRAFLKEYAHDAVYKPLYPVVWFEHDGMRLTYTHAIELADLPVDALLQATPGIFQKRIDKAHELRVTYFGDHYVAVKIYSQQHAMAMLDWRAAPLHELCLEQVRIPEDIDLKCRALMKQLQIVFGCLDIIVTQNNDYYFLEINEQGQFLWIEETNPSIKMLKFFIHLLYRVGNQDVSVLEKTAISLCEFSDKVFRLRTENLAKHKNPDANSHHVCVNS